MCQALGNDRDLARAHRVTGDAAVAVGDLDRAAPHLEQAIALAQKSGDLLLQAEVSNVLGQLENAVGRRAEAGRVLRQSVRLYSAAGEPDWAAGVLHSLAETERESGHTLLARRLYAIALRQDIERGNQRGIAYNLEGLAAMRPALVTLTPGQQRAATMTGRTQPIADTITSALRGGVDRAERQGSHIAATCTGEQRDGGRPR